MKICIVTPQYGMIWSGIGTYATYLINSLACANHEVTVICPKSSLKNPHPKSRIIEIDSRRKPTLSNWIYFSYIFNRALRKLLKKELFNIIHFVDARDSLFCGIKNIPVIGSIHDYYFIEAPCNPLVYKKNYSDWIKRWIFYITTRFLEKRALKKLSFIITNTDYVKISLIKNYKIDNSQVRTVYYGVENHKIIEKKKEKLVGNPSLVFAGGNFERKGLPTILKAISVADKTLPDILLYIIGQDPKKTYMEKLCVDLGIQKNVCFLGWKDNKETKTAISRADMFVMPSLIEGFGWVFLEAMEVGTPVIGGDTGGTPEIIQDGINGFTVKPSDYRNLSEKIVFLAINKELKEKFIYNGYETIKKFSLDRMLKKTLRTYATLVDK